MCKILNNNEIGFYIGKLIGFVDSSTKHSNIKFLIDPNAHVPLKLLVYTKSRDIIPFIVVVAILDKFITIIFEVGSPFVPIKPLNPRSPMLIV